MELYNISLGADTNASNISEVFAETTVCGGRTMVANIIGSIVTILIAIVAFAGNLAVVMASFWSETLREQTGNILVVYLSIVDMMTAVLVMIPSAIAVGFDYWPFGGIACRIHAGFNHMFVCSSSFNLAVISFDRAIAVAYPFKYPTMMTTKVIIMFCGLIFAVNTGIGIACVGPDWTSYDYTEAACALEYKSDKGTVYLLGLGAFSCFYIPAVIIAICNIIIIVAANKSQKNVKTLFVRRDNQTANAKEASQKDANMKKTIKSLIVVIVTYYICFTPYSAVKQLKAFLGKNVPPSLDYTSSIFMFFASATNPFIYGILRKDYQDAFRSIPRILKEKFTCS